MKKVSGKSKPIEKAKKFKPVEFGVGEKRARQIDAFKRKCLSPMFVAECLSEYQSWRRGTGRYEFHVDPEKNAPMPFCATAIGIFEDAAIKFLMHYDGTVKNGKIINPDGTIR
jgi:hypothetical protein